MTTTPQPPAPEALDASAEPLEKPPIPAFRFPFKPGEFADAKKSEPGWYQKGAQDKDRKTPGAAPSGTRRSMGKR